MIRLLLNFPLIVFFTLVMQSQSNAHEVRPAFLSIKTLVVSPAETEADPVSGSQYEFSFKQPIVNGRYLGLGIETNAECAEDKKKIVSDFTAVNETWLVRCQPGSLNYIRVTGLEETMIDTLISFHRIEGEENFVIQPNKPYLSLNQRNSPFLSAYLYFGVEHLLSGFDHVLFLICLICLVSGNWNLVKTVTSFTLAHSLSLGIAALDIVVIPQSPVEAMIALSTLILALEILRPNQEKSVIKQYPWIVAFLFGLLHGLGFAASLKEIGIAEDNLIWALFLFNLGIELGQLMIIVLVGSFLILVHKFYQEIPVLISQAPAYFIGSVSAFWVLSRSLQILNQGSFY